MYLKVKSLVDIKGKVKYGDIGEVNEAYKGKKEGVMPVYFAKHQREFYWKPVWIEVKNLEMLPS